MCLQEAAFSLGTRLLRQLPPEFSHDLTHFALKHGLGPRFSQKDPETLNTTVFGKNFSNPVGLAAGFDKNAHIVPALFNLGFGFVEVGTITQFPQGGNPKPRLFRLKEHKALLNRMGFNNVGMDQTSKNLSEYFEKNPKTQPIGINFGYKPGPDGTDKNSQHKALSEKLKHFKNQNSYFVLNISCPNVKGGRDSQFGSALKDEIGLVRKTLAGAKLFVKTGPDLTFDTMDIVLDALTDTNVDGIIISNTLPNDPANPVLSGVTEQGGLSGAPVFEQSTNLVSHVYKQTKGTLPIIGLGGIMNGEDAYKKICAGASLVQVYTGLVYEGPALIKSIKTDLIKLLEKDGLNNISEAVGCHVK